ncbi:hypothetical protein ACWDWO_11980 [Actinopolymorpha singaporensis]
MTGVRASDTMAEPAACRVAIRINGLPAPGKSTPVDVGALSA